LVSDFVVCFHVHWIRVLRRRARSGMILIMISIMIGVCSRYLETNLMGVTFSVLRAQANRRRHKEFIFFSAILIFICWCGQDWVFRAKHYNITAIEGERM